MKTRYVGMLTVLLAAGCAHGRSSHQARGEEAARGEHPAPTAEARQHAAAEQRAKVRENEAEEQRAEQAAYALDHGADQYGTEADNTRVNERDRESSSLTPLDQGSSDRDRELTQQIRKAVIGDDSLSFTAKNTKIITRDGLVTLRGVVATAREKATLEKTALEIAGRGKVVDELEVEH